VAEGRAWRSPVLFKLQTAGRHFAKNAMGVLAVVHALGLDRARALCGLGEWSPPNGRGLRQRIVLDLVDDHLTFDLIDDAFNANPASMAAALEVLEAAMPRDGVGRVEEGRRIAVLGDMLELGREETRLHADLARHPAMAAVATVHCVGPRMRALWEALPEAQRGSWTEEARALAQKAHHLVDAGDVVLVKGSKASHVSLVVDALRKLGHPQPADPRGTD
jgi:UDP-N-acetylmuramoyl-tripeptide--D-alanyl-D-alanine ligase